MPIEFEHITVPSPNLDEAIRFYKMLDMNLVDYEPMHHAHFENKDHQVIFTVYYKKERPDYEVEVYIEVSDLEMYRTRFCTEEIAFLPFQEWGGRCICLKDTSHNLVTLYKIDKAGAVPPWKKSSYK